MITPGYVRDMARYNRWQNRSLYREADRLSDEARRVPRGAFFGSIHATLSHLLFGDQAWMYRFTGLHQPKAKSIAESTTMVAEWEDLKRQRVEFDDVIVGWADGLDAEWLDSDLIWTSAAVNKTLTRPRWLLVSHMFNHQTHHRGQVHCMLTQLGMKPDDTDLPFMPADEGGRAD
ncbi:MAG: DinB family protein [Hyphomicrobiaceae bacterium]